MLAYLMCFMAGCCLMAFLFICATKPPRKMLGVWLAYFSLIMALAWRIGGLMVCAVHLFWLI